MKRSETFIVRLTPEEKAEWQEWATATRYSSTSEAVRRLVSLNVERWREQAGRINNANTKDDTGGLRGVG